MVYVPIAVTGILIGSVYALAGLGIVLTYKATGVFNLAHFTIALFAAYVLWGLNGSWGISLWFSLPLVLLVVGPGIGVILEWAVFRPLQRRRASTTEKLVANLGVVVLFLGLITLIWGTEVRGNNLEPVPRLWPVHAFKLGLPVGHQDIRFDAGQLVFLLCVLAVGGALYALLRFTFLGTSIQAVVDRRELSELAGIDANRVSMVAWAIGGGVAALTGILLAAQNTTLEPTRIIFFGIEMISVAIVARLRSLPVAVLAGLFLLGGVQDVLKALHPFGNDSIAADGWLQLTQSFSVVVLFVALLAFRSLDEAGESEPGGTLVATDLGRRSGLRPSSVLAVGGVVAAAVALPFFLDDIGMRYGHQMVAMFVIFTSLVCITGFSGHISLGQTALAGLGAYFTARAVNGLHVPVLVGMLLGGFVALVAGMFAGYPALRRKGLFLGLTTLGLGLLIDRLVFQTLVFQGGPSGLVTHRPSFAETTTGFYYFELAVAGVMLLFARNLRSGRLGRILGAMRDSDIAAKSVGIDLRAYKLFIFAASSFIAGVGGALLVQSQGAFDRQVFNPVFGLFWFVAITAAGISSLGGAVLAAVVYVMLPVITDLDPQAALGIFGVVALLLGRLPGGVIGFTRRTAVRVAHRIQEQYARADTPAPPSEAIAYEPTAVARQLMGAEQ